jgi:hypothetical protein
VRKKKKSGVALRVAFGLLPTSTSSASAAPALATYGPQPAAVVACPVRSFNMAATHVAQPDATHPRAALWLVATARHYQKEIICHSVRNNFVQRLTDHRPRRLPIPTMLLRRGVNYAPSGWQWMVIAVLSKAVASAQSSLTISRPVPLAAVTASPTYAPCAGFMTIRCASVAMALAAK